MPKPIINVADVTLEPTSPMWAPTGPAAERFEAKTGVVGKRVGARKLGYNITAVPPGKRGAVSQSSCQGGNVFRTAG
jgi:hypothetical protein